MVLAITWIIPFMGAVKWGIKSTAINFFIKHVEENDGY